MVTSLTAICLVCSTEPGDFSDSFWYCLLPRPRRLCFCHCLFVSNFARKLPSGFAWNFEGRLAMGHCPNDYIFVPVSNRFARWWDWCRDTSKMYLDEGMHCLSASSSIFLWTKCLPFPNPQYRIGGNNVLFIVNGTKCCCCCNMLVHTSLRLPNCLMVCNSIANWCPCVLCLEGWWRWWRRRRWRWKCWSGCGQQCGRWPWMSCCPAAKISVLSAALMGDGHLVTLSFAKTKVSDVSLKSKNQCQT